MNCFISVLRELFFITLQSLYFSFTLHQIISKLLYFFLFHRICIFALKAFFKVIFNLSQKFFCVFRSVANVPFKTLILQGSRGLRRQKPHLSRRCRRLTYFRITQFKRTRAIAFFHVLLFCSHRNVRGFWHLLFKNAYENKIEEEDVEMYTGS